MVVPLIERLALDDCAPERDLALQVMEEWWIPNTLYRKREDEA